jgi:cell shape-determining protein MreC
MKSSKDVKVHFFNELGDSLVSAEHLYERIERLESQNTRLLKLLRLRQTLHNKAKPEQPVAPTKH